MASTRISTTTTRPGSRTASSSRRVPSYRSTHRNMSTPWGCSKANEHDPGAKTRASPYTEEPTATFPRRARPNVSKHRALGHSGTRRINDSNITMDGAPVILDEHDPHSCKVCRLGNTGKGHAPIKHLRDFGRSSRRFSRTLASRSTRISAPPSAPRSLITSRA